MKLVLGTRGSPLALKQANIVQLMLQETYPNIEIQIVTIVTSGDSILDRNLAQIGGKGLFIKEIEEQLRDKKIDLAVHSLKDMPAIMPDIFDIPCVLPRADVRDAFISVKYKSLSDLPNGAVIGTSSARRAAQALNLRPDLQIVPLRGNVQTRISKLKSGSVDATFRAMAGLSRLELLDDELIHAIDANQMLPAVSQGAIGIEILRDNQQMRQILQPLNHQPTFICTNTERSFMRVFEGSCTTPIAANALLHENKITFNCLIAKPDGSLIHRDSSAGDINDAEKIGSMAANKLKKLAGENFFG